MTTSPSKTRNWVIFFAILLSIITYIDRVCISAAEQSMRRDLGFNKEQMGAIFAAFALSYALFEIPSGWLGDWLGPRKVLTRIVLWWSFFTAATAWAWNFASLWWIRFLFGAGEAGCFPNITKAYTTWLPEKERVRAQGITWMSARWGGAFTQPLVGLLLLMIDWRTAFVIFGAVGAVWCWFFWNWFRDDPKEHKDVNEGERALLADASENAAGHGSVPWGKLLASPAVLLLWLQYFCISYGWYFYITWLPTYLKEQRGMDLKKSAILAGLPLFFGGIGCLFSGWLIPKLIGRLGNESKVRRVISAIGCLGAGAMLLLSTNLQDPVWALVAISCASFSNDLCMPAAWGACMSIGGRYAGTLSGSMNMMGNLGGALAPWVIPQILKYTNNNWSMTFYVSAAMYAVAFVSWMVLDSNHSIDKEGQHA